MVTKEMAEETVASSSASGWEMFKESIPRKIDTSDVFMNKNQLSPKKSRQLEAAGTYDFAYDKENNTSKDKTEIAGEEDTLMGRLAKRMASRDYIDKQNLGMGTKASKAATADTADNTMQDIINNAPGKMVLGNKVLDDLKTGIKIEHEHKDTVDKIKAGKIKKNEDAYRSIATDHLKEHLNYYDKKKGLPAMEKNLSKETASIENNHLINDLSKDYQNFNTESITPYWDKMSRIRGKELDESGKQVNTDRIKSATPGAQSGDYTESKTEQVMPGATMLDQAKNTNRTIGKGLENFKI